MAPPRPLASMMRIAATIGDPKITEMAAKLPAAAITMTSCGGRPSRLLHHERGDAGAIRDERGLGSEDEAESEGGHRREGHAGNVLRSAPTGLESVGRHVPAVAGQARDREGDREPGEPQHDDVVPPRHGVVAERVGQVGEDRPPGSGGSARGSPSSPARRSAR